MATGDGKITAELQTYFTNTRNPKAISADVTIWDIDRPRISIEPISVSGVDEGAVAMFKVSADPFPTESSFDVRVNISEPKNEGFDFLMSSEEGEKTVTLTPKTETIDGTQVIAEYTGELSVPTQNDDADEANGYVVATILTSTTYNINPLPEYKTTVVRVRDNDGIGANTNDLPLVSIAPVSANPIIEGGIAQFTLTATEAVDTPYTVEIGLTNTGGDFIDRSAANVTHITNLTERDENNNLIVVPVSFVITQVEMPANRSSVGFSIQTLGDQIEEPDGSIIANIVVDNSDRYRIFTSRTGTARTPLTNPFYQFTNTATVQVLDDDAVPEISISTISTRPITEGTDAEFRVSANRLSLLDKVIQVSFDDGDGNFIDSDTLSEVTIPAGSESATYIVKTDDDEVGEDNGEISVTLVSEIEFPVNYTVSPTTYSTQVSITDNDGGVVIPTPDISISADVTAIVEGDSAKFYLTATVEEDEKEFYKTAPEGLLIPYDVIISSTGGTNFISGSIPTKIKIQAGENETNFEIATEDDAQTESNGTITVTVQDGSEYNVNSNNSSASVAILDNDGTTMLPKISIVADSIESITEGAMANFTIRSDSTITATAGLEVRVAIGEYNASYIEEESERVESDFISDTQVSSVTIPMGQSSVPIQIQTLTDEVEELDGRVFVRVLSDNTPNDINYLVDPDQNNAEVTVWDDDDNSDNSDDVVTPVDIGISLVTNATINEGENIRFLVQTKDAVTVPANEILQVNVQVSQVGDFVTSPLGNRVVEIANYSYIEIATHDDILDESDGSVTATLQFGKGYRIISAQRSATATIQDDSDTVSGVPVLSIKPAASSRTTITEADKAEFVISATSAPTNKLSVRIEIDEGTTDFLDTNQEEPIEFPDGVTSYTHAVSLNDDNLYETDGMITLRLLDDNAVSTTYAVATPPNHEASVSINDNDELPEISIAPVYPIVAEAQAAVFTFTATSVIATEKTRVNLSLGGSLNEFVDGDALFNQFKSIYINDVYSGDTTQYNTSTDDAMVLANGLFVEFDANATTATLTIPINDDTMVELDGSISVTILSGDNYEVDSDAKSASILIRDNDIPTLTIVGGNAITEGETATFTLTMTPPPLAPVSVDVLLAQTEYFITVDADDDNPYAKEVDIDTSTGMGTLEVATNDDTQDEHNGFILASLHEDSNTPPRFKLSSPFSASVTVNDNDPDLPRVSIALKSGQTTPITEGRSFVVELTADPAPQADSPLTITLDIEETGLGTGYYNSFSPDPIEITDGNPVEVTISTHGDDVDEDHGEIRIAVEDTSAYIAAVYPNNSVSVTVNDNETDLPIVSITSNDLSIVEGGVVRFMVSMTPPPAQGTTQTVTLENTPSSSFFNQFIPNPLVIPDSGTVQGFILTNNNDTYEGNSEMVLAVNGVANQYRPASAPNNALTVEIRDDDLPVIAISDFVVLEGTTDSTFNIPVSISPAPVEAITISYSAGLTSEATIGNDFDLVGSSPYSIELTSTQLTGQIPITINSDSIDERPETFVLVLTTTNAVFENDFTNTIITGKITEKPIVSISSQYDRVSNSDYFAYTVAVEPSLSSDLTVELEVTDAAEDIVVDTDESPTAELTSTNQSVNKQLTFNSNPANNSPVSITISENPNYIIDEAKGSVAGSR